MQGTLAQCGKMNRRLGNGRAIVLAAAVGALASVGSGWARGNAELDVPNGASDLTAQGATAASDLTFTNIVYSPTAFTANTSLGIGTLDDLDATQTLMISNAGAAADSITLNGGSNSVAGTNAADLLFVAGGGTLTINGGTGVTALSLVLGASPAGTVAGNLNVAGTANIGAAVSWGSNPITKTGTGTLALTSGVANTSTGSFTIANGTVSIGGGGNAGNTALGAANTAVSFGLGSNNTTLAFTAAESGIAQNFTVASGAGTRKFSCTAGNAATTNAVVFAAANTLTLSNNLTVTNTVAGTVPGINNIFGFRGVISQSGGTFGVTVDTTNVGTVDLRGANTFGGGVTLNGGVTTFNLSSTPNAVGTGTITNGPLGTGTIVLGGDAGTAASLGDGSNFSIANPMTVGSTSNGSARTIFAVSQTASTGAGSINGAITLNADLTLSTNLVTSSTGNDRLRVGGGGITGSNNIIINNPNLYAGFASKTEILLTGTQVPNTTWTGDLIISQGQGALGLGNNPAGQGLNATGTANAVRIGSGATFDFSSNSSGIAGFNPTIAGLADFGTISTPSQVFTTVNVAATPVNNRVLTLGGSGTYAYSGLIEDSVNTTNPDTTGLTITLTGNGVQTLSGPSTYTGGTILGSGKFVLGNGSNGSATGPGTVSETGAVLATLSGTGTSSGALTVGSGGSLGRIAPGVNTSGTNNNFGVAGTVSLGTVGGMTLTAANLDFDLSPIAGGVNDLIATGGILTLGTDSFTFNALTGTLDTTTAYTLISGATGAAPSLAGVTGTVIGGAYTPTFSLSGDNVQVSFAAVPEPASLGLLGGAAGLMLLRRRRRGC